MLASVAAATAVGVAVPTAASDGAASPSGQGPYRLVRAVVVSEAAEGLLRVAVRLNRPVPRAGSGVVRLEVFLGRGDIALGPPAVTIDKERHCYAGILEPVRGGVKMPRQGSKTSVRLEIYPGAHTKPFVLKTTAAIRGDRAPIDDAFVDRGVPELLGCGGAKFVFGE